MGKPYYSLDCMLKERFGEKVYKLALNAGCTCPNRDGTLDTRGCIFCSAGGSGDFAGDALLSVPEQIEAQKKLLSQKRPAHKFIAYFQAYTNTYGPLGQLEAAYEAAIEQPEVAALSIATRPDCLGREVLDLLERLNRKKPVWVELGLQTIHQSTADYIRRGYDLPCFEQAVRALNSRGLEVIVHTILGLPRETREDILETMRYLNTQNIQGIKLQLLHVLRGTDLAQDYLAGHFQVYTRDEYIGLLISCLEVLSPSLVIHRVTGDGPRELLLAPAWSSRKREVLNTLHHQMKLRNTWQGKYYEKER